MEEEEEDEDEVDEVDEVVRLRRIDCSGCLVGSGWLRVWIFCWF